MITYLTRLDARNIALGHLIRRHRLGDVRAAFEGAIEALEKWLIRRDVYL